VLVPLSGGRGARYQRYDWPSDSLAEWREVASDRLVVVEGVYVLRRELRGYYEHRIWIEADRDVRLRRGLERDGEAARER
jgi:uridine kinase